MTILVCPLSRVEEMVASHRPGWVISLLDPEGTFPELGAPYSDRHLRLSLHDIQRPSEALVVATATHIAELLQFLERWDPGQPLLIHCRAGISRSTATAYIAACFANPEVDEHEIAMELRRAAPLSRPNEWIVRLADQEMGRGGRMSAAIVSTGRDLSWLEVEEGEPFQLPSTFPR